MDEFIQVVFVDALAQQVVDNEIEVRVVGVVGEVARVGHHACVDTGGCAAAETSRPSGLPHEYIHQCRGR